MEGTFAEFVKFLTSDPIMLGLCVAVISLIFIFILVLCFGDRKKKLAEKNSEYKEENTSELLKMDLNDEPLKSTQEFNLNLQLDDNVQNSEKEIPVINSKSSFEPKKTDRIEPILPTVSDLEKNGKLDIIDENEEESIDENNAPITINEALSLKNSRDVSEETIKIPKLNLDTETNLLNDNSNIKREEPRKEILKKNDNLDDIELPTIKLNTEEIQNKSVDKVKETTGIQPFSSVYLKEQAEIKGDEEFSKTEIIRHIPKSMDNSLLNDDRIELPKSSELELPKLNTDKKNSVLSVLTGETFQINR